jgi:hypothetical protein
MVKNLFASGREFKREHRGRVRGRLVGTMSGAGSHNLFDCFESRLSRRISINRCSVAAGNYMPKKKLDSRCGKNRSANWRMSKARRMMRPGAVIITLRLKASACANCPWKNATSARVVPHAGQAARWKRSRQMHKSGPCARRPGGMAQHAASANNRTSHRGMPFENNAIVYFRSGLPWASGNLFIAIRMMSTNFQIPQPPRVTSLRIPRPV